VHPVRLEENISAESCGALHHRQTRPKETTMRKVLFIIFAVLLAACTQAKASSELEQNRALWEQQDASNYQFELSILCFCPYGGQMPLSIVVRDGQVVSLATADGSDPGPSLEYFNQADTVEELFGIIESAQAGGADDIKVQYDPDSGYPVSIDIDYIKEAVDDEISYQVANLEFLP
jgi:hypothetical protein